jgi:hypothetical protein
MSNFTVLHVRKIKTMLECVQVIKHNHWKTESLEEFIDTINSCFNFFYGATDKDLFEEFEGLTTNLLGKIQKNVSGLVEVIISFSPEFCESWENNPELRTKVDNYFISSEVFLRARFRDIFISRTDPYGEHTPHLHLMLYPIPVTKNGNSKGQS